MPSEEYYDGRNLESNSMLFETLNEYFKFDSLDSSGGTTTKTDIIGNQHGVTTHFSLKYASGSNTQVHLPTLYSMAEQLCMPKTIFEKLDKFLGTNDVAQWYTWIRDHVPDQTEKRYQRILSHHIADWNSVVDWFNVNNKKLAQLLLQKLETQNPIQYLIWANKKKGGIQLIDVNKFITYIDQYCRWITMPKGTVLRCQRLDTQKPIFFMQMKNSGGPPGGYNRSPQFHLCSNWPNQLVVYEKTNIRF